jgi:hypothetical protein
MREQQKYLLFVVLPVSSAACTPFADPYALSVFVACREEGISSSEKVWTTLPLDKRAY